MNWRANVEIDLRFSKLGVLFFFQLKCPIQVISSICWHILFSWRFCQIKGLPFTLLKLFWYWKCNPLSLHCLVGLCPCFKNPNGLVKRVTLSIVIVFSYEFHKFVRDLGLCYLENFSFPIQSTLFDATLLGHKSVS